MTPPSNDPNPIDFLPVFEVLRRRLWLILAIAATGALTGLIFSKLVTPLYESSVSMYPSNSNSREKQLEDFSFGHEVHAERLMQLLNSNTLLDSLEMRFKLCEHYGIDKSERDWYDRLYSIYRDRVTFHKNKYVSVSISVVDADPEFCSTVANEAARLVNVINADIVKNAARSSLEVVEKEYKRRLSVVKEMNDSIQGIESTTVNQTQSKLAVLASGHYNRLQYLRDSLERLRTQYNVQDFSYQINVLNEHLAEARANYLQETGILEVLEQDKVVQDSVLSRHKSLQKGAKLRMDAFQAELTKLSSVSRRYNALEQQIELEMNMTEEANLSLQTYQSKIDPNLESRRLARMEEDFRWDQLQTQELNEKYQRALSNYLDPVAAAIVVSSGRTSYKKIYPHTLVNIALGLFGGLFFGVLLFSFIDRRRGGRA